MIFVSLFEQICIVSLCLNARLKKLGDSIAVEPPNVYNFFLRLELKSYIFSCFSLPSFLCFSLVVQFEYE